ncbi:hypothetical protein O1L44_04390 [Streptomyces noursei]|nr:hypothetical protein [Streptomyces noursei]
MTHAGADGGQTASRCDDERDLMKLAHKTLGPSLPVWKSDYLSLS